jgi:hypothetical protein
MRFIYVLCLAALAVAMQGCSIYGYQSHAVRVPIVDSAGKAEVGGTLGTGFNGFSCGGIHANYSPVKHLIVGVNGDMYYNYKDSLNLFSLWGSKNEAYFRLRREGYATGAHVGYYLTKGAITMYLQAGAQGEYVGRSYQEMTRDENGSRVKENAVTINGRYVKPWAQVGVRIRTTNPADYARFDFTAAVRLNKMYAIETYSSITNEASTPAQLWQYPNPKEPFAFGDLMLGGDLSIQKITFSGRGQLRMGRVYSNDNYWHTPSIVLTLGLAYTFGKGR